MRNLLALVIFFCAAQAHADEKLAGIACRSVHLGYGAKGATALHAEATIVESQPGTYFSVIAWDKGYFGLQELGNGKRLAIFSVWDSGSNDPNKLDESKRVKVLHKDPKVRVGRFGGEGSGGQSFFDFDWKPNTSYEFVVTAKPDGDRTEYAGYLLDPAEKEWRHLITFSTITGGKLIGGFYSFVEDFKRDKVSLTRARTAKFGDLWQQGKGGEWTPLVTAKFTGDANPATNIDAFADHDRFTLSTGGATKKRTREIERENFDREPEGDRPEESPEAEVNPPPLESIRAICKNPNAPTPPARRCKSASAAATSRPTAAWSRSPTRCAIASPVRSSSRPKN